MIRPRGREHVGEKMKCCAWMGQAPNISEGRGGVLTETSWALQGQRSHSHLTLLAFCVTETPSLPRSAAVLPIRLSVLALAPVFIFQAVRHGGRVSGAIITEHQRLHDEPRFRMFMRTPSIWGSAIRSEAPMT